MEFPFWIGLVAVVGLIYSFNLVIFVAIVYSILRHAGKSKIDESKSSFKRTAILAAILFIMFGLGWFVGLLGTSSLPEEVFIPAQIIFTIIVGLQGFFIFVLHVLRSPVARKQWKGWFSCVTFKSKPRDRQLGGKVSLQGSSATVTLKRTSSTYAYNSATLKRSSMPMGSTTDHAVMSLPTLEEDVETNGVEEDRIYQNTCARYRNRYAPGSSEGFTWSEQTENDTETTETVFFNFEAVED